MDSKHTAGSGPGASSGTSVYVKIREAVSGILPDSFFPDWIRERFTAEKAALISLVIGIAGDIPVFLMTNYLGVFLVIVFSLAGAYLGLYALKIGAALPEKDLSLATIGTALSVFNILLVFFVMIPGIHAVGEFEDAADDALRQLDEMGSMF